MTAAKIVLAVEAQGAGIMIEELNKLAYCLHGKHKNIHHKYEDLTYCICCDNIIEDHLADMGSTFCVWCINNSIKTELI